jgi:hypothetical protein
MGSWDTRLFTDFEPLLRVAGATSFLVRVNCGERRSRALAANYPPSSPFLLAGTARKRAVVG